jgi:site-specific DNA-methyltransferase (adenine-specific)
MTTGFVEQRSQSTITAVDQPRRAPNNRTIGISQDEIAAHGEHLITLHGPAELGVIIDRTIHADTFKAIDWLPKGAVDLLFLDPPYNVSKTFGTLRFAQMPTGDYAQWMDSWLSRLVPALRPTASVYICGNWQSSAAIQTVAQRHFTVRNRVTWEREKGRGSRSNWKSASEDLWFCTVGDAYTFNVDSVLLRRRVLAPYRDLDRAPKDWHANPGGSYRDTYPSNLWTDLTVPFWSMPENTDHPTQKSEKLLAKIILASSNRGDLVLDPFLGSGTTSVVAKKLGRRFIGIEADLTYACLTEKRLSLADRDSSIQGFEHGVFWERNSKPAEPRPDEQGQAGFWKVGP